MWPIIYTVNGDANRIAIVAAWLQCYFEITNLSSVNMFTVRYYVMVNTCIYPNGVFASATNNEVFVTVRKNCFRVVWGSQAVI